MIRRSFERMLEYGSWNHVRSPKEKKKLNASELTCYMHTTFMMRTKTQHHFLMRLDGVVLQKYGGLLVTWSYTGKLSCLVDRVSFEASHISGAEPSQGTRLLASGYRLGIRGLKDVTDSEPASE